MADLFRNAAFFREPFRTDIRTEIINYANIVITEEWPLLADARGSDKAYDSEHRIINLIGQYRPEGQYESIWYQEMVEDMNKFADACSSRIFEAKSDVPKFLWLVLIIGGIVTISFCFLFGTGNFLAQTFMTGSITTIITLVLILIYAFDHPFTGIIMVKPDDLILQKEYFERQMVQPYSLENLKNRIREQIVEQKNVQEQVLPAEEKK